MEARPFVATIGGTYLLDVSEAQEVESAARHLGAELAKAGFGLVVYFSDAKSLEPHVVAGYVPEASKLGGKILVRYSQKQRGQVKFAEEDLHKDLFEHVPFPSEDWEAPFYRSLTEESGVEAVLLVAGGTSTLIAGQIAVARRLPILALDGFGGSAYKIWQQLAMAAPDNPPPSWRPEKAGDLVAQLKQQCDKARAVRAARERQAEAYDRLMSKRARALWAVGPFVLLLVIIVFGMVRPPAGGAYTLVVLIGLICAGATGASARAVVWGAPESDGFTSILLGAIAGFVVGLAYLIPQWIGAPGVLVAESDQITATDKIQFASALLVAISAGVGFDTVFRRLREQAETVPTNVNK